MKVREMKRLDFLKGVGALTAALWLKPFQFNAFSHMNEHAAFDVLIVGGSYAGLSAAMTLGRGLRKVLVVDSGRPCNRQTPRSHNVITLDGATPAHIAALAKEQVLAYSTVTFKADTVTAITGDTGAFVIGTVGGDELRARKILFATGVADHLPAIEGLDACWGISAIHCPYCHGYEYRHQPTGILVNGPAALEFGKLIRNWTRELTIFTNGTPTFSDEQQQELRTLKIEVVSKEIRRLEHNSGQINALVFAGDSRQPLQALYTRPPFSQHCPLPQAMGCKLTEAGLIETNEFGKTSVPGVYAAGDCRTMLRSVAGAMAAGSTAGGFLNHEMISEEV